MADDMSDEDRRSLAEWAAKDGATEAGSADDAAAQAAREAEAAKAAEIFAAGKEAQATAAEAEAAAAQSSATGDEDPSAEAAAADEAAKDAATAKVDDKATAEPPRPARKAVPLPGWMKDRLAEQAGKQRDAERLAAEARARAEVAEAELAELRKRNIGGEAQVPTPQAAPSKEQPSSADFVPRTEVEARAAEIARVNAFNAQADQAFFAGKAAYPDFEDALQPLQALGALIRMDFQEAALATGAAHDVLYELGSDPDKASKILGYLKSGNTAKATAEMTRLADGVAARKAEEAKAEAEKAKAAKNKKTPVSAVPPPIRTVGGSALPTVDLDKADDETFDKEFSGIMRKIGW